MAGRGVASLETPGERLKREIEAKSLTQSEFAAMIERSPQSITDIVTGKRAITPDTAVLFEVALGVPAEEWLRLEAVVQIQKATNQPQHADAKKRIQLFQVAPIKEMMKHGWIDDINNLDLIEKQLLDFFNVRNVQDIRSVAARFKMSEVHTPAVTSVAAWLRRVEIVASEEKVNTSACKLSEAIVSELKTASRHKSPYNACKAILAENGVRLVHVKHLRQTYLDGAALITDDVPTIAVTLRYNRVDNFMHGLLHEYCHLLLHSKDKDEPFWDENVVARQELPEEQEANYKAAEWLIERWKYQDFVTRYSGHYSEKAIKAFADSVGVDPAVVVGRLQHDRRIPYSQFRSLLRPVA